jgi:phosphatidylserine decarboxylase
LPFVALSNLYSSRKHRDGVFYSVLQQHADANRNLSWNARSAFVTETRTADFSQVLTI